jgi:hypothetical protein
MADLGVLFQVQQSLAYAFLSHRYSAHFFALQAWPDGAGAVYEVFRQPAKHLKIDRRAQYYYIRLFQLFQQFGHIVFLFADTLLAFRACFAGQTARTEADIALSEQYQTGICPGFFKQFG